VEEAENIRQMRRNPSVIKKIGELSLGDRRVRLSGKIEKKNGPGSITLADSTGKAEIFFDNLDIADDIENKYAVGDAVLVFGLVVPQGAKFDINGEILAKSEALDSPLDESLVLRAEKVLTNDR